jgi:hypothetical protein
MVKTLDADGLLKVQVNAIWIKGQLAKCTLYTGEFLQIGMIGVLLFG